MTIGSDVGFVVNQQVVIEDGARIASHCSIRDSDSHPMDHRHRLNGAAAFASEIKPVRICRNAWIGAGCMVNKGVTIGEGAIIGGRSVVMTDIPPEIFIPEMNGCRIAAIERDCCASCTPPALLLALY